MSIILEIDFKRFKRILSRSAVGVWIIGIVLIGMSSAFIYEAAETEVGSVIGLSIFGGLFGLIGLFVMYMTIPNYISVKSGRHPLLKAIKDKDADFLLWVYRKQINTTAGLDGPTIGSAQNLIYYDRDGKLTELVLGRKTNPDCVIEYLASEFPNAYLGYSDSTRKEMSKILGKDL